MCNPGRITFPPRNVDCSLARRIISNSNNIYITTNYNVLIATKQYLVVMRFLVWSKNQHFEFGYYP